MSAADATGSVVVVVADDLIWAMRLASAVERAGHRPIRSRHWDPALAGSDPVAGVIVDLAVRGTDGVGAVEAARAAGLPTIAVGQHEDLDLRRRALAAGAERVYAYNKLFRDGPEVVRRWLGGTPARDTDPEVVG